MLCRITRLRTIIDAATADVIAVLKALQIDKTPPVTTAVVAQSQPDGQNGWYVHAVTVSLSVYDNLSGAAKTEYSLDSGSTWQAYTSPLTFDKDDKYTVSTVRRTMPAMLKRPKQLASIWMRLHLRLRYPAWCTERSTIPGI